MRVAGFDLADYRRTGVQLVKGFFEPEMREQIAALGRQVAEGVQAGKVTRSGQFTGGLEFDLEGMLAGSDRLHQAARSVLGDEELCFLTVRVLMKDKSFNGSIHAHQDWPYFGGNTKKLNIFVPLTRCRPENGTLIFYEGSHGAGPVERGDIDIDRYPEYPPVQPAMEPGDALFADFLTWHSSAPATEDEDRIMLQAVLQPVSDRSSNNVFGKGRQYVGREVLYRSTPMRAAVPSIGVSTARGFLNGGAVDEAERIARGLRVDSLLNVEAHLLLRDIALRTDEDPAPHLLAAQEALAQLTEKVEALSEAPAVEDAPAADETPAEDDVDLRAEVEQLKRDLAAVRASTSWRLTAPLRWLRGARS